MKKICIILFCLLGGMLLGCGGGPVRYGNQRADDVISKAIYKELGRKASVTIKTAAATGFPERILP